ncbi:MAG TPA: YhbY family RNA-binding protein [Casimicrobiaceae bacterium]|nr:YhbY family RNA-binding protein [Casimicrobiaceae bacterium]
MEPLRPSFRRALRARAHPLHPVVSIGQHGLTPAVLHEIDVALLAHELIKVRVFNDDRDARTALLTDICTALGCTPVQQIGKLLVVWRARPATEESTPPRRPAAGRKSAGEASPAATERRRGVTKRVNSPQNDTAAATPKARARPPGKAPSGVPRAAAPRRRRGFGNAR